MSNPKPSRWTDYDIEVQLATSTLAVDTAQYDRDASVWKYRDEVTERLQATFPDKSLGVSFLSLPDAGEAAVWVPSQYVREDELALENRVRAVIDEVREDPARWLVQRGEEYWPRF